MRAARGPGSRSPGEERRPIVNTHVHLPPNFSAFRTVEDAVDMAAAERVRVLGASNFHDLTVYPRFAATAERAGVVPLFGFEVITVLDAAARQGMRVNDPENPGRAYLCGKGVTESASPSPAAERALALARSMNEARMDRVVVRLGDHFARIGLDTGLGSASIAADVASRSDVPLHAVVLQERHVAEAFQGALFRDVGLGDRRAVLTAAFGAPPRADPDDPVAVQGEIRSRLIKIGGPAYEPESPVAFEDAVALILELGGIPCYPTLADGASPVCPWEEPPTALAERLLDRGIHAAELIPVRNRSAMVDAYVAAFRDAGIVVMAGTEHNTHRRIPLEPRCSGGDRPSAVATEAFWEGTCVVAAHQERRAAGHAGYVDRSGRLDPGFPDGESRIRWYRELGAELIAQRAVAVAP